MKTLQQIKDEVAKDNGFVSWDNLTFIHAGFIKVVQPFNDEVSKRFAIEVAKESLRNAAENIDQDKLDYVDSYDYSLGVDIFPNTLNIESILDENNIPSL